MASFGKRPSPYAGSGIDKPEPDSMLRKGWAWLAGLLKPNPQAAARKGAEPPSSPTKGRRRGRR